MVTPIDMVLYYKTLIMNRLKIQKKKHRSMSHLLPRKKEKNSNEPHLKIYNVMATWKSNKRQGTDVAGDFEEQDGGYMTPLSDIYI